MASFGKCCSPLFAALCCLFLASASAKTIVVGGEEKWSIPTTRIKDIRARVGDVLLFEWVGVHTVVQTKAEGCDFEGKTDLAGVGDSPFELVLEKPGKMYFACDIPTHCPAGMSVAVTVRPAKKKKAKGGSGKKKQGKKGKKSEKKSDEGKKSSKSKSSKKVTKTDDKGTATVQVGGMASASAGGFASGSGGGLASGSG